MSIQPSIEPPRQPSESDAGSPAAGAFAETAPQKPLASVLSSESLPRGATIGRYLVLNRLGAGGMGVVYAAYDPELSRKVAIKLLRTSGNADGDTQGRVRLLREAQAMARLSHPNVISVFDVGTAFEQVFVAMEFIDGGTLSDWLSLKPRTQSEIVEKFYLAGAGLAAAHSAGLIHRDFKPDNVLVGSDGRVRVTDFGLARDMGSGQENKGADESGGAGATPHQPPPRKKSSERAALEAEIPEEIRKAFSDSQGLSTPLTQAGAMMGTPRYMSPEQFRGQPTDARSDQFSFCVALFEALAGMPPFAGESLGERCYNVLQGNVLPPPSGKRAPTWLQRALLRGLSVAPNERFPNMDALLGVLSPEARQGQRRAVAIFLGLAALSMIIVGVAAGVRWQRVRAAQRCDDSAQRVANIFGPAIQERAHQALMKTGKMYAGTAWERVEKNVNDDLAQWSKMRAESCRATYVGMSQSKELHARRMRCLDNHLQEVAAFTALIQKADAESVDKVAETSSGFTAVSTCADTGALWGLVVEKPNMRERVDAVYRDLSEIRVMSKLARYEQAQERAQKAVDAALQIGYAPVTALAYQQLATIENDNADVAGAERDYFAMATQALQGGDHRATAVAFVELMRVAGRYRKQFEQADRYGQLAVAALNRANGTGEWISEFQARRLWYKCQIDAARQELGKAEQSCQEALALRGQAYGVGTSLHIGILISLANVFKREDKFAEALALYKQALVLGERAFGEVHPNIGVDLSNMGSLLAAQGKYDEAAIDFEKALVIYKRIFGEHHPRLFGTLAALARNAYRQEHFAEALRYATEAKKLSGELSNATVYAAADCLLGDVLYRQGKFAEAEPEHQKAVDGCDAHRCEQEMPYFLVALADDFRGMHKTKQALPLLEQALRLQPPTGDRESLARNKFSLAQAVLELDKKHGWTRAEELASGALVLYRAVGRSTQREQAEVVAWLDKSAPR